MGVEGRGGTVREGEERGGEVALRGGRGVLISSIAAVLRPLTLAYLMPGRSTSGCHQPGRHRVHQARRAVRRSSRMKGRLHPTENHLLGGLSPHLVRTFLHIGRQRRIKFIYFQGGGERLGG